MAKIFYKKGYKHYADSEKPVHVHVAEMMVGGPIYPGYVVHHIDGNKSNNERYNLRIMSRREHSKLHAKPKPRKRKRRW